MKTNLFLVTALFLIVWVFFPLYIHAYSDMDTIAYDQNLTFYIGKGGNSVVLTSNDGNKVLIIDTKQFGGAKELRKKITASDITIINSHFHMDHTRGNKLYPDAYVVSGECNWKLWNFDSGGSKRPDKVLQKGETFVLHFNNEIIQIINIGSAHTSTECLIYFEKRKLLVAGDIIWNKAHPMVLDSKCSIANWLAVLNKIETEFEITTVVPGHGSIGGEELILEMRNYFLSIKNNLDNRKDLRKIKREYKDFKRFPLVCNFSNSVRKLKREFKR
jgi:cyclase